MRKIKRSFIFFLFVIILSSCESAEITFNNSKVNKIPSTNHEIELHPAFDLKNPDFSTKFMNYFDMDKAQLIEALHQDFSETPIEGVDSNTDMQWIKLEKVGLQFYLTEEMEVPVSHVDIEEASPVHFGRAKARMNFEDIMKQAGDTLILEQEENDQVLYSILYPLDGVSVIFNTKNVFENSSKMKVSSWGYYDKAPTLLHANEIPTYYGIFKIPDSWVGRVSLIDYPDTKIISYLGRNESFPLFQIISMSPEEWDEMSTSEQERFEIIDKEEGWVMVMKQEDAEPSDEKEAEEYRVMTSGIEGILKTFEPFTQITLDNENNDLNSGAAPSDSYFAEMILRAYEEAVIDALNNNDFGRIEKYLIDKSEFYNKMKSMISEQASKGETFTLISFDIEDIVQQDDGSEEYDLYVKETIAIYDENQSKSIEKTEYWIYTIISNENSEGISKRTEWKTTE